MTEFTCAECGGTFESLTTHEAAIAEMQRTLRPVPETASAEEQSLASVCDECYEAFLGWARREGILLDQR